MWRTQNSHQLKRFKRFIKFPLYNYGCFSFALVCSTIDAFILCQIIRSNYMYVYLVRTEQSSIKKSSATVFQENQWASLLETCIILLVICLPCLWWTVDHGINNYYRTLSTTTGVGYF